MTNNRFWFAKKLTELFTLNQQIWMKNDIHLLGGHVTNRLFICKKSKKKEMNQVTTSSQMITIARAGSGRMERRKDHTEVKSNAR